MEYMNGEIKRAENRRNVLKNKEMLQCLAVLIYSYKSGLTFDKSIYLLRRFRSVVPSLQQLRWISKHLKIFPIVSGRHDGSQYWMLRLDQKKNLEHFVFKDSRDIFMHIFNIFLILDDDLFGTCVSENQVKRLSSRKTDWKGHSGNAAAEALSSIIFVLQFRSREESQVGSIKNFIEFVLRGQEGRGP